MEGLLAALVDSSKGQVLALERIEFGLLLLRVLVGLVCACVLLFGIRVTLR